MNHTSVSLFSIQHWTWWRIGRVKAFRPESRGFESRSVRVGLLGRPLQVQKHYMATPGTKCSETHLFAISGSDPIFIYDLLKPPISQALAWELELHYSNSHFRIIIFIAVLVKMAARDYPCICLRIRWHSSAIELDGKCMGNLYFP